VFPVVGTRSSFSIVLPAIETGNRCDAVHRPIEYERDYACNGFARDEGGNTEIADPQHSPKIRSAFQLRWFRKVGALATD
jgi:hypothetical protein